MYEVKDMRKKLWMCFMVMFLSLSGCANDKTKIQEVVIYVEQGSEGWLPSEQVYEELQSVRIDAFNKRLEEMNAGLKLVVKNYPHCSTSKRCDLIAQDIVSEDADADIVTFNQRDVSDLEPLDSYFDTEEGKKYLNLMSKNKVKILKINNSLYHFPKMLYPLVAPVALIDADYYQAHKAGIDAVKDNGKDLLTYFRDHYEEKEGWLLADGLNLLPFFNNYENIEGTCLFIRKNDGKVVNPYDETEIKDILKILAEIRWKGYTGKNLEPDKLDKIIESGNFVLSSSDDLSAKIVKDSGKNVKIDLGKEHYSYTSGFSILKASKHKEEAFKLLAVMNTDEESSSILQFGVNPKRNSDGKIIDDAHLFQGSWNNFGNNLIIESAENEPENKQSYFKKLEEESDAYTTTLYPKVFDLSSVAAKLDELEEIAIKSKRSDTSIMRCLACNVTGDIQDPEAFMEEIEKVRANLKKAGIDEVVEELQRQLDEWKENETAN